MKFLIAGLFLIATQAQASDCPGRLADTNRALLSAEESYSVGEVTMTDVNMAKLDVLMVQLNCYEITKKSYCEQAPELAQSMLTGIVEEMIIGARSLADYDYAKAKLSRVKAACFSVK